MLGPVILAASRSDKMRKIVSAAPVTKPVVNRFIPGETVDQVIPIVTELTDKGLEVTLDVVGEDITTVEQSYAARDAYLELIGRLKELGLGTRAEMSVKLSMFGQALEGGHELALANVRPVVEAAAAIGTTVGDQRRRERLEAVRGVADPVENDVSAVPGRLDDLARRVPQLDAH
ncbi:proline dehydrogenase, partial [Streptomyces sp. 12297]